VNEISPVSWVFGYGSLMWNPGFPFEEHVPAELSGYHRAFCVYSHHHRGTFEVPGLVMGLDQGGHCAGVAFRVSADQWDATMIYLDERELVGGYPYAASVVTVKTPMGDVAAHTYIPDPRHPNYAGRLTPDESAQIIRAASGIGGSNRDYLVHLVQKLDDLRIDDSDLRHLLDLTGGGPGK